MMQSVALTDLCSNDDEYVLVEAAEEADDNGVLLLVPHAPEVVDSWTWNDDGDDDASYDYCDDVCSIPSSVRSIPSIVHSPTENLLTSERMLDNNPPMVGANSQNVTEISVEGTFGVLELGEIQALHVSELDGSDEARKPFPSQEHRPELGERLSTIDSAPECNYDNDLETLTILQDITFVDGLVTPTSSVSCDLSSLKVSNSSSSLSFEKSSVKPHAASLFFDENCEPETAKTLKNTSRPSNKKRRKQLKLTRKATAAAAAAAALSHMALTATQTPPRRRNNHKKKRIAPDTVGYSRHSLERYKKDVAANNRRFKSR